MLRRRQSETRTWNGGSVGENPRASQPATSSSSRPTCARSTATVALGMGLGAGLVAQAGLSPVILPLWAAAPTPTPKRALMLSYTGGPSPGPKPLRRARATQLRLGLLTGGSGGCQSSPRVPRVLGSGGGTVSPAPPCWVSEHEGGPPLPRLQPCWLVNKALPSRWASPKVQGETQVGTSRGLTGPLWKWKLG